MHRQESKQTFTEAARRTQILQSTIATVNDLGYHRTSLAGIAEHAGVAKSAIVYYFDSKENLLMHVIDHAYSSMGAVIESAVSNETGPSDRLRAFAESYLTHVDTHRTEMAAASTIVVSHRGADGTPLYLTETDEDTALLRDILTGGMAEGAFRQMPVMDAVRIVESLLDVATTAVQRDLGTNLATLIPQITQTLLLGLANPAPGADHGVTG